MDSYEATRVVFTRIQNLDPEYASKIMGLLLIQDHGEKEMIRLAFGPESLVHSVILKARKELGISSGNPPPPSTPSTPSSPSQFSPHSLSRQNSANSSTTSRLINGGITNLPSPLSIPSLSSSWNNSNFSDFQPTEDHHHLINNNNGGIGSSPSTMNSSAAPFYGGAGAGEPDLIDELQIQDQLSFLNDGPKASDFFYPDLVSPNGSGDMFSPWGGGGGAGGGPHRRSSSVNDICLGVSGEDPNGWKPCLYFARGYCKNGASCRFTHGGAGEGDMAAMAVGSLTKLDALEQCQELLRSKSAHQQRLLMAAAGSSPNFPFPNSPKSMNFLLQQQPLQSDSPRMAAAAAAALMMGEEMNKFGRSRLDRNDFSMGMLNPGSRQIYLTFPADSTFREEDVSNYFSIYGPVQDVRIPYQQKRMFGFVTFVYAETVKLILAKGNPHFVCDARVLVKPYKEKGKVPDKFRKQQQQQMDRSEFSSCGSPTGFDSRDPFDLQLGARMLYNSQDLLWRKKLEEQADFQHAIELQNRRLMDLQLLDVKRNHHHHRALSSGAAIPSPTCYSPSYLNHSVFASDNRSSSSPDSEDGLISKMVTPVTINVDEPLEATLNLEKEKESLEFKDENSNGKSSPHHEDVDLPESLEHNLPDNLFASPKASGNYRTIFSNDDDEITTHKNSPVSSTPFSNNGSLMTSPLLPATSTLDLASLKSCYFQFPRFSSGHGAIGM